MSADNWTTCPRCLKKAEREKEALVKRARDSYGKVTPEEYEGLLLKSRKPIELDLALREDFEFYLSDKGCFTAHYTAKCDVCDFGFKFDYEKQLSIEPE